MKRQLTITDLTRMKGDRVCIFGVDQHGTGIRPDIYPAGIREYDLMDKGGRRIVTPFAVVEFDMVRPVPKPPHTEDWEVNLRQAPRLIRRLSEEEGRTLLTKILDGSVRSIFGADVYGNQYINEGEGLRSLGTVRAKAVLSVNYSSTQYERYDYRLRFADATGEVYDLPITDLALREYCDSRRIVGYATDVIGAELKRSLNQSEVLIRVGLARPFAKMHNRCYLQVCAIHAFPGYAQHPERTGSSGISGSMDWRDAVSALVEAS